MKKVFLTAIVMAFSAMVFAQGTVTLSLEQAKNTALTYNRTLQNASLDIRKAQAQRWQTIASMLLNVTAGYNYQNNMGYQLNLGGMPIQMPPTGIFQVQVNAQISGQQIVTALVQNIAVKMADISKKQTEQTTLSTTTQLYMSALANEQIVNLLDSSRINIEKIYNSTLEAVRVGSLEQTEADKLYVQVMKIASALNSAKQSLEILYNSLKLQLGIDANTDIVLTDNLDNLTNAETALELLHSDFNINDNYSYQLLQQNLKLAKKQITLAAMGPMGYSPSLSVGYTYSDLKYFTKDAGIRMSTTPPNSFLIRVSVPLFTSGRVFEAISEKSVDYKKMQNTFADAENQLNIQDKQLRYTLNSAYENFQIQKKNIEVTNRVFDNVSEKFYYGKASSLEVTQASTDFITAQNAYIQALMDMVNAQIALRNLLNK